MTASAEKLERCNEAKVLAKLLCMCLASKEYFPDETLFERAHELRRRIEGECA